MACFPPAWCDVGVTDSTAAGMARLSLPNVDAVEGRKRKGRTEGETPEESFKAVAAEDVRDRGNALKLLELCSKEVDLLAALLTCDRVAVERESRHPALLKQRLIAKGSLSRGEKEDGLGELRRSGRPRPPSRSACKR